MDVRQPDDRSDIRKLAGLDGVGLRDQKGQFDLKRRELSGENVTKVTMTLPPIDPPMATAGSTSVLSVNRPHGRIVHRNAPKTGECRKHLIGGVF